MKTGTITWNGKNSLTDLGVYVSGPGAHNAAEADVTAYQIPGRNGDLIVSNNRYKNIAVTYPAFIPWDFSTKEQGVRNWLRSSNGYETLEDTYDTSHFRLGRPVGEVVFTPERPDAATFEIAFDCMPQRFLTAGTSPVTITSTTVVTNPTDYDAKPLITVSSIAASAEIQVIGDDTFTLTAATSYANTVVIDCETQNIYDSVTLDNKNDLFSMPDGFPVLTPGANTITVTGSVTSVSMEPRWWEL